MKKLIVLFVIGLSIISCASNDDESTNDPIIGKWQLLQSLENGIDQATVCTKKTTVEFKENGTFVANDFYENSSNICISETSDGHWSNQNGIYKDVENDESLDIIFENNNTTFYIEYSETYQGVVYTEKTIFKRI